MGGGPSAPAAPPDPNVTAEYENKKARQLAAISAKYEGRLGLGSTNLAGTDRKQLANIGVDVPGFSATSPIDTAMLDNSTTGKATTAATAAAATFNRYTGQVTGGATAPDASKPSYTMPTGSTSMIRSVINPAASASPDMDVANAQNKYNRSLAYWAMKRKGKVV